MQYEVDVMERWARTFTIESDKPLNKEELQARANEMSEGAGDYAHFEYSDTIEPDQWTVRELDADGGIKRFL